MGHPVQAMDQRKHSFFSVMVPLVFFLGFSCHIQAVKFEDGAEPSTQSDFGPIAYDITNTTDEPVSIVSLNLKQGSFSKMARATRSRSVPLIGFPESSKLLTQNQAFNEMVQNCDFMLHQNSQSKKTPIKPGLANRLAKIETDVLRQEAITANLVKLRKNSFESFAKYEVHIGERFAVFDHTILGLSNSI